MRVGSAGTHLGQSLLLRERDGREDGPPPAVDLAREKRHAEFVRAAIDSALISAVHDVSDGGALVALAEMALAGGIGCDWSETHAPTAEFFGEDQATYLVTVDPGNLDAFAKLARAHAVETQWLGETGGDTIRLGLDGDVATIPLADLRRAHEGFFPKLMGADAALA